MRHPDGHVIEAHVHNPVDRTVQYTQEVLLIKRGKLRVDFYDGKRAYLQSRVLGEGDIVLLASGGHGFKVLEEVEMIEVKQGPYAGDADKTRFRPVTEGGRKDCRWACCSRKERHFEAAHKLIFIVLDEPARWLFH